MTRDRIGTQELDGVLGVLDTAQQQALSAPADGPPQLPPRRANGAPQTGPSPALTPAPTGAAKLFEPVRVEGEEQLGRAVGDDKIAILRKKVRALEDRVQAIREAWNARDAELDEARQNGAKERQRAEAAEESARKLAEILQSMKQEVGAYHGRVTEAMQEAARREQELRNDCDRRVQEAQQLADERVREAQQEAARRVVAMSQDAERREQQAKAEGEKRLKESLQQTAQREQQALHELSRLQQEAAREHEDGLAELQRKQQEAQQRREQELQAEHQRHNQALQREHQRREQEAQRREQAMKERAEAAERALRSASDARELQKAAPPPPPVITKADVEELAQSVDAAGRTISGIIKGRVRESDQTEALREVLGQLRANHELLSSVLRDME